MPNGSLRGRRGDDRHSWSYRVSVSYWERADLLANVQANVLGYGIRQAQVRRCLKRPRSGGQNEHRFWLIGRSERMAPKQHPHGRAERHAHASPRPSRRRQNRVSTRAGASDPEGRGAVRMSGQGAPPGTRPPGPGLTPPGPGFVYRTTAPTGPEPTPLRKGSPAPGPQPVQPPTRQRATCPPKPRLTGPSPRRPERRYCWRLPRAAGRKARYVQVPRIRQYEQGIVRPLGSGPGGGRAWSRSARP